MSQSQLCDKDELHQTAAIGIDAKSPIVGRISVRWLDGCRTQEKRVGTNEGERLLVSKKSDSQRNGLCQGDSGDGAGR
jgi:hypothetical protein